MMDFGVRIMFVLLLISLQLTGGDFSPSGKKTVSSKILGFFHKMLPKSPKNKNDQNFDQNVVQGANDSNSYLEWVSSAEVPKDAVSINHEQKKYYIAKYQEPCKLCFFDKTTSSCVTDTSAAEKKSVLYKDVMFLVNKDNFEMIELKKCTNQTLPHKFLEICGKCITFGYHEGDTVDEEDEVLALNTDYKMQHLNIIEYLMSSVVTSENLEVLKHFQASNRNCNPSKHTVKFDQNIDKTSTYQTGKTHTTGGSLEISVGGEIPKIVTISGKFGLKHDYSRSRSNTTSVVDKTLHSVSMDMEVPPNHSCSIDITSKTFMAEVPFIGEMTRVYKTNEIRKTIINGTYSLQEVAEIQTLVNPCKPLSEVRKC